MKILAIIQKVMGVSLLFAAALQAALAVWAIEPMVFATAAATAVLAVALLTDREAEDIDF